MQSIAILRRNGLGDLLCAFPLVLYLQKKYPAAALTLFVDPRNMPLIPYLPPVQEVVVFPTTGNKYLNHFRLASRYRNRFDLAISAKTSPMRLVDLFLYWLKAKKSIAYVDSSWHSRLVTHPLPYCKATAETLHQALKGLHTVNPGLAEVPEELYPSIQIPESIREKYSVDISWNGTTILVSATTTRPQSRLEPQRYAQLLNRLHEKKTIGVIVIGQKEDQERAEAIAAHLRVPHRVHFPRNFDEFMVWLSVAEIFFVGDGGVAHIGAALGKRVIALFGGIDPRMWHPLGKKVDVLFDPIHVDHLSDEDIFQKLAGE